MHSLKRSLCLTLLSAATGLIAAAEPRIEPAVSADSVACYDFVEVTLTITASTVAQPFADAAVTGKFGPAGGTALAVDGFCDATDGSVFRIRFMPTQPGPHEYTGEYRTSGFARTLSGRFEATDGKRRGQLRADPAYPRHLRWAGTQERLFWSGLEADGLTRLDDTALAATLERLDRCRITGLSITLAPYQGHAATDLAAWARLEHLIALARERTMVVALEPPPSPDAYAHARLTAFSNVIWTTPSTLMPEPGDTRAAWQHVLSGGYFTLHTPPGLDGTDNVTVDSALEPFGHLYDFFTGIPWWELRPEPGLVTALHPHASGGLAPRAFAARNTDGDLAAVYVAGGGVVTVKDEMLRDQLKPLWFSPRDGGMRNARALRNRVYRTPTADDWVLLFRTPCNCSFRDFDNEYE